MRVFIPGYFFIIKNPKREVQEITPPKIGGVISFVLTVLVFLGFYQLA